MRLIHVKYLPAAQPIRNPFPSTAPDNGGDLFDRLEIDHHRRDDLQIIYEQRTELTGAWSSLQPTQREEGEKRRIDSLGTPSPTWPGLAKHERIPS